MSGLSERKPWMNDPNSNPTCVTSSFVCMLIDTI